MDTVIYKPCEPLNQFFEALRHWFQVLLVLFSEYIGLSSEDDHYYITLALTTSVPIISILAILAAMSIEYETFSNP
ncbi:unnamed protein product [Brugia pahangi]|uniref:XK-related protein n=1 Tax=Brugia pahangi TaxID=6280 RepID=A0A0N4TX99_BRUPA|nr:unnamed protein product [Brugia pahangi]